MRQQQQTVRGRGKRPTPQNVFRPIADTKQTFYCPSNTSIHFSVERDQLVFRSAFARDTQPGEQAAPRFLQLTQDNNPQTSFLAALQAHAAGDCPKGEQLSVHGKTTTMVNWEQQQFARSQQRAGHHRQLDIHISDFGQDDAPGARYTWNLAVGESDSEVWVATLQQLLAEQQIVNGSAHHRRTLAQQLLAPRAKHPTK